MSNAGASYTPRRESFIFFAIWRVDQFNSSAQFFTFVVRSARTFNHSSRSAPESSTRLSVCFRVAIGSPHLTVFVPSFGYSPALGRRLPRCNIVGQDEEKEMKKRRQPRMALGNP